jgi:hypothetical protein
MLVGLTRTTLLARGTPNREALPPGLNRASDFCSNSRWFSGYGRGKALATMVEPNGNSDVIWINFAPIYGCAQCSKPATTVGWNGKFSLAEASVMAM